MPEFAQRSTVIGQFDATPAAIEQSYAKGVFEIGYRLGNYRLRNRKMGGGTAHSAGVRYCHEDMEVAQLEAGPNAIAPRH